MGDDKPLYCMDYVANLNGGSIYCGAAVGGMNDVQVDFDKRLRGIYYGRRIKKHDWNG